MDFFKKMDAPKANPDKSATPTGDAEHIKCLIIGSGPAGYTAAIYAARANMKPVIIQGMQAGGQLTTTTEVDNFPGYPEGTDGTAMMEDLKKQAERFGTEVRWGTITETDLSGKVHKVIVDGEKVITADTLIIATGATAKYLGIPSEEKYRGGGVSACATCDGFFYSGKDVAVVGGGDTAAEEATYLANLCKKVYLIIRKDHLRASKAMQKRVFDTPNIEVLFEHNTKEIIGDGNVVQGVKLIKRQGEADEKEVEIKVDGFFLAIGHTPNSGVFKPYVDTDETGYIITKPDSTHTNVPGVFACGDVQDHIYRQAITAAGSGCMAALDAERYMAESH
jgi:thioredoxin reductase (NADPH)